MFDEPMDMRGRHTNDNDQVQEGTRLLVLRAARGEMMVKCQTSWSEMDLDIDAVKQHERAKSKSFTHLERSNFVILHLVS